MTFLIDAFGVDDEGGRGFDARLEAYHQYLRTEGGRFPPSALAFASAPWHYDFRDHQCPHDAWVESLTIREPSAGSRRQHRGLEINVRLLGAYHDGYIELLYRDVRSYSLAGPRPDRTPPDIAHGDWLIDEVRLSEDGSVEHEILFSQQARWLIQCQDMEVRWLPLQATKP